MTEQASKSRFAIDIDELERQLRQTASTSPGKAGPAADPLAELARIVGKDDPFKAMFEQPKAVQPVAPAPQMAPVSEVYPRVDAPPVAPAAVDDSLRGALSEFDSLLREEFGPRPDAAAPRVEPTISAADSDQLSSHIDEIMREQQREQAAIGASDTRIGAVQAGQDGAYETADPDLVPLTPRSNRKGLLMIVGLVGVAAIGVVGAVTFKPGPKVPSGEPPTIKAAVEPTKVQPQNPGGTEVPNQNRQILERQPDAKPADTKVVTTEEQPMDVQAAARQAARVVLPGAPAVVPTPAPAAPVAPAVTPVPATPTPPVAAPVAAAPAAALPPATAPLGEPRRVRTVAIRPDGSVIGQPPAAGSAPAAPAAPSISTMATPPVTATVPPPARPATAAPAAATTPAAAPVKTAERITAPPAAAATPAPRPATAAPAPAAQRTAAAPAAPAAADTTGGFAVQLGAPGSEAEARSSFAALQRRFPEQLGSRAPVVRKAELADGRTVYRLRVGPLSRESATSLCQSLQSSGGSCFIARN